MQHNRHYLAIKEFYGDQKAERSGVPYINHIDEGLIVLDLIGAAQISKEAYCLHPIFQADEALAAYCDPLSTKENKGMHVINKHYIPCDAIILAMEYRRVANSYLSKNKREDLVSCPLPYVKEMLIADKVQNRKDFELYHKGTHPRSAELDTYFRNWMEILEISEPVYKYLSDAIRA